MKVSLGGDEGGGERRRLAGILRAGDEFAGVLLDGIGFDAMLW